MMHTMTSGPGIAFPILHMICCLLLLAGIAFLFAWAIKTLTHAQLKTWGIGLFAAGIVLCVLTCLMARGPITKAKIDDHEHGAMMQGMNHSMGGMMMHDSSMTMDDMMNMLKGKTGDAFDKAFLEGMIPHHQGAVDMANATIRDAKHEELKQLARDIITSQQKEIDLMKKWQKDWGYTQ